MKKFNAKKILLITTYTKSFVYGLCIFTSFTLLTITVQGGGGGGDQISIAYCLFSFIFLCMLKMLCNSVLHLLSSYCTDHDGFVSRYILVTNRSHLHLCDQGFNTTIP